MFRNLTKALVATAMIFSSFIASACNPASEIKSVSAQKFKSEMTSDNKIILDVRTPEEYAAGHIADAVNINVLAPGFSEKASKAINKEDTVYVYCRSGKRSLDAARKLSKIGYKVVNLKGGIIEWQESELPVTKVASDK